MLRIPKTRVKEYPEFNNRLNNIESSIRNVFRRYQNDNNGQMPLSETLKDLLDVEIRKIQPIKQKQITLFEYIEKFIERSKEGTRMNIKTKKPTVKGTNKGLFAIKSSSLSTAAF